MNLKIFDHHTSKSEHFKTSDECEYFTLSVKAIPLE